LYKNNYIFQLGLFEEEIYLFNKLQQNSIQGTGCTNLLCPGFVQTSTQIYLGTPFSNVSSVGGPQFSMLLYLSQVSFMLLITFFSTLI